MEARPRQGEDGKAGPQQCPGASRSGRSLTGRFYMYIYTYIIFLLDIEYIFNKYIYSVNYKFFINLVQGMMFMYK